MKNLSMKESNFRNIENIQQITELRYEAIKENVMNYSLLAIISASVSKNNNTYYAQIAQK